MNLGMLVYMAGIFGVGAVIAETDPGLAVSGALLRMSGIVSGHDTFNLAVIAGIGAVIRLVATLAVLAPLAGDFAHVSGLPVLIVLFSTVFPPYQNSLMVIGMQAGGVNLEVGTRFCLARAGATVIVPGPLDYLWWWVPGYLP